MSQEQWTKVGTIRKGKKEGSFYLKVDKQFAIDEGDILSIQNPRKTQDTLAEKGYITQEVADERKAKIPDYIMFDVVLPPAKK